VKAADFNNDGFGDAISWNELNGNIGVDTGTASDGLQLAWTNNSPLGKTITINDFNSDGILDFATYLLTSTPELKVFFGNGDATFASPVSLAVTGANANSSESAIASGDMNGDGNCDLVYAYGNAFFNTCSYGILFSNGAGGFFNLQTASVNGTAGFLSMEVGLINNDNIMDIVIGHEAPEFSVLYGIGNATYAVPQIFSTTNGPREIIITHLDFDPYPDLVFTWTNDVYVHYGNSAGTFTAPVNYMSLDGIIACADVNGDWFTDIIGVNAGLGAICVHPGDGNRNFAFPDTMYQCETATYGVCVTDVDNDGLKDIIDARFALFRNVTPGAIITSHTNSDLPVAEMTVYPNPATEQVTLSFFALVSSESSVINIYSIDGKLQYTQTVSVGSGENNIPVNVNRLQAGLYLVELSSGERKMCQRIVVR
jgi:hypothetical protein